jgi:glycine/D-amino acid oxidase-like deaminating enzyme
VCGAGVVGASVAYFLARGGVAVTIVERSAVACAASGKSGGFLALDWCDDSPLGPLARASFELHAQLARELTTDYGYRRVDTYMMTAWEHGRVPGGHRVDAPRWLDGAGVVVAPLGSVATTAQVHPARFMTALVEAARTHGAVLHIGIVDSIVQRDGAVAGVSVDGTSIDTDAVVLAMGPWTSRAAKGLRVPRVRGLKGYSITLVGAEVRCSCRPRSPPRRRRCPMRPTA